MRENFSLRKENMFMEEFMEVKNLSRKWQHLAAILFVIPILTSCATVPDLEVNYRLPLASEALKGKTVCLEFKDLRTMKGILGKGAQKEFKDFSGNFTFSLARGAYDLPSLFQEVFKRKLENMGVEVLPISKQGEVGVMIALEDFFLDLIDRKWVVTMAYEGRLIKGEQVLAKQKISGRAERFKWIGRKQAKIVMGEFFTDMVNRLDISRLFKQGGL
jgi:hypothetical protein